MIKLKLKNKPVTILVISFLLLLPIFVMAQQNKFRYKADVAKIDSDGVYRIELQPRFTAKNIQTDLSDIRLIDESGKSIAFKIVVDSDESSLPTFIKFAELKQETPDTNTIYIADAGSQQGIDNLWLQLKNTQVNRRANLSGSDNLKDWFAIKEGIELQSAGFGNEPEYEQAINFPLSKYRYFRLQIDNKHHDPLKIIRSGIYINRGNLPQVKYFPLPAAKYSFRNDKNSSIYSVTLDDKYFIDGLNINVGAPKYYSRLAIVHSGNTSNSKYPNTISLSSANQGGTFLTAEKSNHIEFEIRNDDDTPLSITGVVPLYLERSLVAYLEKGHKYALLVADSTASEVSYDLTFLHSRPTSQFPVIQHFAVYQNPAFEKTIVIKKRDYTFLIWAAIGISMIILGLLTWRMVKEVNLKQ